MSKPTENDVHLWIGDMLRTIYYAALIIFHYSKKGEVPYGRQSLISMQKLYMIYGYGLRSFDKQHVRGREDLKTILRQEIQYKISTDNTPA